MYIGMLNTESWITKLRRLPDATQFCNQTQIWSLNRTEHTEPNAKNRTSLDCLIFVSEIRNLQIKIELKVQRLELVRWHSV